MTCIGTTTLLSLALACITSATGCTSQSTKKAQEAAVNATVEARSKELASKFTRDIEQKQKADATAVAAAGAERDGLAKTRQELFEPSGLTTAPSIEAHLQSVLAVTLASRSRHLVSGIRAEVDFSKDGDVDVSMPISLGGALPAGGTKTSSMADQILAAGSVESSGGHARVVVTAAPAEDRSPRVDTAGAGT